MTLTLHGTNGITFPDGTGPADGAALTDGWTGLETQTASTDATVLLSTGMDGSTYAAFRVQLENILPASDDQTLYARFRQGGSVRSDSTYHDTAGSSTAQLNIINAAASNSRIGSGTNEGFWGRMDIASGASGTNPRPFEVTHGSWFNGGSGSTATAGVRHFGTYDGNKGTIDGIQFLFASGNIASGVFRLYGMKAAA